MIGISPQDLRLHVIRPTLKKLNHWTKAAENLLLATCAHESLMGCFLKQRQGTALGIYQIEPATHTDVWQNYLNYRPYLAENIKRLATAYDRQPNDHELITNLAYATAIARMIYYRISEPLPTGSDIEGQAIYWKKYYNTKMGKGCIEDFIQHAKAILI